MTAEQGGLRPGGRPRRLPGWGTLLLWQDAAAVLVGLAATFAWTATRPAYFWPRWVWFGLGVVLATQYALRWALARPPRPGRGRAFTVQAALSAVYVALDVTVWALSGRGFFWPVFTTSAVALALLAHAWWLQRMPPARERELTERVAALRRTRSGALDVQAAELKRIERDLHDGAQARMVSLAMNLGLASELLSRDPDAVAELLVEARGTTLTALEELRTVMEGIQPPVLADRGLVGAVEAVALDLALPVEVTADVPGRLAAPVESAVYFATTECLANVVKHARAARAWVDLVHRAGTLTVVVGDDGAGGAAPGTGTGLRGVARRLEVFDGTVSVDSPPGGPTRVTMEVPCALSSPKTSPSSGTA
ncbi:Signal transduction histidine kinase [Actinacidiphila yanglinensis]|uniref:histidine kinase n=1 Tax=Actinacidiphila yanglinensis TaxID=310779 RepID=A0A1H6AYA7_9ACTN|nr:histidine kinase [Actinacidiphila yanglinensis]SEG53558.1 Signal transduction histidine kinase [Actinacidiphila yanglinensis]